MVWYRGVGYIEGESYRLFVVVKDCRTKIESIVGSCECRWRNNKVTKKKKKQRMRLAGKSDIYGLFQRRPCFGEKPYEWDASSCGQDFIILVVGAWWYKTWESLCLEITAKAPPPLLDLALQCLRLSYVKGTVPLFFHNNFLDCSFTGVLPNMTLFYHTKAKLFLRTNWRNAIGWDQKTRALGMLSWEENKKLRRTCLGFKFQCNTQSECWAHEGDSWLCKQQALDSTILSLW